MHTYLATCDVATLLRVPRREVIRMVDRGVLTPAMKLPGRTGAYLFDPVEVERVAAERTPQEAGRG